VKNGSNTRSSSATGPCPKIRKSRTRLVVSKGKREKGNRGEVHFGNSGVVNEKVIN